MQRSYCGQLPPQTRCRIPGQTLAKRFNWPFITKRQRLVQVTNLTLILFKSGGNCFRMIPSYGWKSLQLVHNENVVFWVEVAQCLSRKRLVWAASEWRPFDFAQDRWVGGFRWFLLRRSRNVSLGGGWCGRLLRCGGSVFGSFFSKVALFLSRESMGVGGLLRWGNG